MSVENRQAIIQQTQNRRKIILQNIQLHNQIQRLQRKIGLFDTSASNINLHNTLTHNISNIDLQNFLKEKEQLSNKNQYLQEQIKQLQDKLNWTNQQFVKLKRESQSFRYSIQDTKSTCKKLTQDIKTKDLFIQKLKKENDALNNKLHNVYNDRNQSSHSSQNSELQIQYQLLKKKYNQFQQFSQQTMKQYLQIMLSQSQQLQQYSQMQKDVRNSMIEYSQNKSINLQVLQIRQLNQKSASLYEQNQKLNNYLKSKLGKKYDDQVFKSFDNIININLQDLQSNIQKQLNHLKIVLKGAIFGLNYKLNKSNITLEELKEEVIGFKQNIDSLINDG